MSKESAKKVKGFALAISLMDDEIRENVHEELSPCSEEEFLEEYKRQHLVKYGEEFVF